MYIKCQKPVHAIYLFFNPWRITKVLQWGNPPTIQILQSCFLLLVGFLKVGASQPNSSCQDVSFPPVFPKLSHHFINKNPSWPFRHAGSSCTPKSQVTYWISRKACIGNQTPFLQINIFRLHDKTKSSPLNNGWLEYDPFLLGFGLFSGANCYCSFREGKLQRVGGFNPIEKIWVKNGNLPQV